MTFEQHYSSSRANLYTVTAANSRRLLLECGVPWSKLQKALSYDLTNIDGCLLTHEHQDHCKAVHDVTGAGIDVYASEGTFKAIEETLHLDRRAKSVPHGYSYDIVVFGSFHIFPFDIIHDAAEPLGYIVSNEGEYLLFCPDSGYIKQRFNIKFNIIALECSYDINILQHRVDTQDINETLAKRLLESHAEKQTTMNYLAEYCDLSKCREIHLLHMSADNIDKQATKKEFEQKLFIEVVIK